MVNGTIGGETGVGYSITLDKTADQILAAINEGKSVIARVALEITVDLPLVSFDTISGNIIFAGVVSYSGLDSILPVIYFLRLRDDEATIYSSVAIALDPEGKLPQVSMANAPTSDMQIATKKYVDDHATGMDITGATVGQIAKIAAVDASGVPTAWSPVDMPSGGSSDFIITATLDDNNNCTVDKTYAQIQEAVQAGKKPVVYLDPGGATVIMPLVASGGFFGFAGSIMEMPPMSTQYVVSIQHNNEVVFDMAYGLGLGHDETLQQVRMSEEPVEAMEIATKKYVDDKEFILQSTTPNSTKKFKITVDDTGALSAVEVTT